MIGLFSPPAVMRLFAWAIHAGQVGVGCRPETGPGLARYLLAGESIQSGDRDGRVVLESDGLGILDGKRDPRNRVPWVLAGRAAESMMLGARLQPGAIGQILRIPGARAHPDVRGPSGRFCMRERPRRATQYADQRQHFHTSFGQLLRDRLSCRDMPRDRRPEPQRPSGQRKPSGRR